MHHQAAVSGHHRLADAHEELEDRFVAELSRAAVVVDRPAVDVLHGEERLAGRRLAAVDQPRDRRMGEPRQDLPLGAETAARQLAAEGAAGEDLERHALAIDAVGPLGEEHAPHAAFAELAEDAVAVDALRQRGGAVERDLPRGTRQGLLVGPADVGGQQLRELGAELRIGGGDLGEERAAALGVGLGGDRKQLAQPRPALRRHVTASLGGGAGEAMSVAVVGRPGVHRAQCPA